MHSLLLCFLVAQVMSDHAVRDFVRAMQRGDRTHAQSLRATMNATLSAEHQQRLSLPSGQTLRWQLRQQPDALPRLQQLALQYEAEARSVMRGFLDQHEKITQHATSRLVALYHFLVLLQQSELMATGEKALLHRAIDEGRKDDKVRRQLASLYEEHVNKRR